jgi:hypothetical protein
MRPGLENSADPANNLKYLAYTLERAAATAATAANGDGKFVILIDYAAGQFSLRRAPSLATSKATLAMIQDCYPERLAAAFMCDSPPYFLPVFRLLKPFIDPVTSAKSERRGPLLPHTQQNRTYECRLTFALPPFDVQSTGSVGAPPRRMRSSRSTSTPPRRLWSTAASCATRSARKRISAPDCTVATGHRYWNLGPTACAG